VVVLENAPTAVIGAGYPSDLHYHLRLELNLLHGRLFPSDGPVATAAPTVYGAACGYLSSPGGIMAPPHEGQTSEFFRFLSSVSRRTGFVSVL
jgi:hypothetical protein